MTDLHDAAIKRAIRTLVDSAFTHVQDLEYRAQNYIMDPDTKAEMSQDVEELRAAIDFLKKSGMVAERNSAFADSFIEHIRRKL